MAFRIALLLALAVSIVSADWELTWQDTFDGPAGSAPDGSKWGYDIGGGGWGNNELEYYTSSTNNAQLDGYGNLNIIAQTNNDGQYYCSNLGGTCPYTSARLLTKGKFDFQYGRFEVRAKLPRGKGMWPAFWSLGVDIDTNQWPNCGEIDAVEIRGSQPNTALGTIHGPGYSGAGGLSGQYTLPGGTFNDDFHNFTVEWDQNHISWAVDYNIYETRYPSDIPAGTTWVFDHPFFLLLNLAVGGNFDGNPDGSYGFPQYYTIDSVTVYHWV